MPNLYTLRDYINATLDKNYNAATADMFRQIAQIAKGSGSAVQRAIQELEKEAQRLQEAGEPMKPDNPALKKTLSVIDDEMTATQSLVSANSVEVQESGQSVAAPKLIAMLLSGLTVTLMAQGRNPLTETAQYEAAAKTAGVVLNIPNKLDFAESYVTSPAWIERMEGWGKGYSDIIADTTQKGLSQGWSPIRTAREVRKYAEQIPLSASENITRTLQLTSYRNASAAAEVLNGQYIEKKVRVAKLDMLTCLTCLALNGTEVPLGESVSDHYRGRCELPENLISGASISSLVSRSYNGEIVVISTASGKLLPVTPNHPILTDRGWISAKLVRVGDNVIQYGRGEWASVGMYPNKKHVPTEAHNISRSFSMRRFGSVPISSEDFHGDGIDGDVGVVWTNRFLRNVFNPIFIKPFGKELLSFGSFTNPLSRFSDFAFMAHRQGLSPRIFLSSLYNLLSFCSRHLGSLQTVGVCLGADINPGLYKDTANDLSGNFQLFMNRINRSPSVMQIADVGNLRIGKLHSVGSSGLHSSNSIAFGFRSEQPIGLEMIMESLVGNMSDTHGGCDIIPSQIRFDGVVEVSTRSYSGHVYSLQSDKGWYISNGIISHNCDAILIPVGGSMPTSMQADSLPGQRNFVKWQTGEEWFASLSPQRQAQQASFLKSPAKFAAYRDGVPLSDFVGEHEDDVFGMQVVEKSLKQSVDDPERYYVGNVKQEG